MSVYYFFLTFLAALLPYLTASQCSNCDCGICVLSTTHNNDGSSYTGTGFYFNFVLENANNKLHMSLLTSQRIYITLDTFTSKQIIIWTNPPAISNPDSLLPANAHGRLDPGSFSESNRVFSPNQCLTIVTQSLCINPPIINNIPLGSLNFDVNPYHIYIVGGMATNRYLLSTSSGGYADLWTEDDNSLRQRWNIIKLSSNPDLFNIKVDGGTSSNWEYLSSESNTLVDCYVKDDSRTEQRWEIIYIGKNIIGEAYYHIKLYNGNYLSVPSNGEDVDIYGFDDYSGRQQWFIKAINPTRKPTKQPSLTPTKYPTKIPTKIPTNQPTLNTVNPTLLPSKIPSITPTMNTIQPTLIPTKYPTNIPSMKPTTLLPTNIPSNIPTQYPSLYPTKLPTNTPVIDTTIILTTINAGQQANRFTLANLTQKQLITYCGILVLLCLLLCVCLFGIYLIRNRQKRNKQKIENIRSMVPSNINSNISTINNGNTTSNNGETYQNNVNVNENGYYFDKNIQMTSINQCNSNSNNVDNIDIGISAVDEVNINNITAGNDDNDMYNSDDDNNDNNIDIIENPNPVTNITEGGGQYTGDNDKSSDDDSECIWDQHTTVTQG